MAAGMATAADITWFLQDTGFTDGTNTTTLTGSLVYNADTNTFSSGSFTTSGGGPVYNSPDWVINPYACCQGSTGVELVLLNSNTNAALNGGLGGGTSDLSGDFNISLFSENDIFRNNDDPNYTNPRYLDDVGNPNSVFFGIYRSAYCDNTYNCAESDPLSTVFQGINQSTDGNTPGSAAWVGPAAIEPPPPGDAPEPATFILGGGALLAIGTFRKRLSA
jgi:hypothetical protein